MSATKLRAADARLLLEADQRVSAAKSALEETYDDRKKLWARFRDRAPVGEEIVAGKIRVKRIVKSTGRKFKLNDFLAKHKLTAAMKPFVSKPSQYEQWQVKDLSAENASS